MGYARSLMKKKILLIFTPLSIPTSPPLGIVMLKGYIEREMLECT